VSGQWNAISEEGVKVQTEKEERTDTYVVDAIVFG